MLSRSSCKQQDLLLRISRRSGIKYRNPTTCEHDGELAWLELPEKVVDLAGFRIGMCMIGGNWSPSSGKLITHCALSQSVNQYVATRGCLFSHCDEDYGAHVRHSEPCGCHTWLGTAGSSPCCLLGAWKYVRLCTVVVLVTAAAGAKCFRVVSPHRVNARVLWESTTDCGCCRLGSLCAGFQTNLVWRWGRGQRRRVTFWCRCIKEWPAVWSTVWTLGSIKKHWFKHLSLFTFL